MHDGSEIISPMQYQPLWLVLGIVAALLVVAWYLLIPSIARRSTRRRAPLPPEFVRAYGGPMGAHDRALQAIDQVEQSARAGAITVREAHLRLSAIVREFAWDMTRIDARTMTLTELKATGFTPIADAVAQFYPIAFQEDELTDLGSIADVARGAVTAWR